MAARFLMNFPESGLVIHTNAVFREFINKTDFGKDKKMQQLMDSLCEDFMKLVEMEECKSVQQALETISQSISDQESFITSTKILLKLAQETHSFSSQDQLALFLGSLGIIVSLVTNSGPSDLVLADLKKVVSQAYDLIFYAVLVPLWNGTENATDNFFACGFIDTLRA